MAERLVKRTIVEEFEPDDELVIEKIAGPDGEDEGEEQLEPENEKDEGEVKEAPVQRTGRRK